MNGPSKMLQIHFLVHIQFMCFEQVGKRSDFEHFAIQNVERAHQRESFQMCTSPQQPALIKQAWKWYRWREASVEQQWTAVRWHVISHVSKNEFSCSVSCYTVLVAHALQLHAQTLVRCSLYYFILKHKWKIRVTFSRGSS